MATMFSMEAAISELVESELCLDECIKRLHQSTSIPNKKGFLNDDYERAQHRFIRAEKIVASFSN